MALSTTMFFRPERMRWRRLNSFSRSRLGKAATLRSGYRLSRSGVETVSQNTIGRRPLLPLDLVCVLLRLLTAFATSTQVRFASVTADPSVITYVST